MAKFKVTFRDGSTRIITADSKEDVEFNSPRWDIKNVTKVM